MQGRRIEKPASGMAISVTTYSDGTISRTKEVLCRTRPKFRRTLAQKPKGHSLPSDHIF